jgi:integrase
MPSKRLRRGKTKWEAQVNLQGFGRKIKIFKTKAQAAAWELEVKKLLDQGLSPETVKHFLDSGLSPEAIPEALDKSKTPSVSLLEWHTDYLEYAQRFSEKTFHEKHTVAKHLLQYFDPQFSIENMTPGLALDYLQSHFKARSGHAANKERKNLVAAWNWGIKYRGFPQPNPFALVDEFAHDVKGHYVPPERDFWKVVSIAEGQDKVMLLTFLYTAARRGEIFGLKWDDVVFDSHEPRIA